MSLCIFDAAASLATELGSTRELWCEARALFMTVLIFCTYRAQVSAIMGNDFCILLLLRRSLLKACVFERR